MNATPRTPREAWLSEREKAFAVLGLKPDPARNWWIHLDADTRRAAVTHAGLRESLAGLPWDALPQSAIDALRIAFEKRRRLFARLSQEFPSCMATQ